MLELGVSEMHALSKGSSDFRIGHMFHSERHDAVKTMVTPPLAVVNILSASVATRTRLVPLLSRGQGRSSPSSRVLRQEKYNLNPQLSHKMHRTICRRESRMVRFVRAAVLNT